MLIEQYIQIFGNFWYAVAAFAVAISVIVAVHEYGHYIVGRWCGIHADVFSLGFGPTLISRVDRHGTRWQLAAIPLGGYVKFKGDANASSVGGTEGGRDAGREAVAGGSADDQDRLRAVLEGRAGLHVGDLLADMSGAALGMGGDADEPADTGLQDLQGHGATFGGAFPDFNP